MKFGQIVDVYLPVEGQPTGTTEIRRTFRIQRQARRLDAIDIKLRLTTTGTAPSGAAYAGLVGAIKRVRVKVSDGSSNRTCVDVSGQALASFLQFGNAEGIDRNTAIAYASTGWPINTTIPVTLTIPFTDTRLQEPIRNIFGIPLWQLGDDLIVEVDFNDITASNVIFGINPPTYAAANALIAIAYFREGTEKVPYIPTELITRDVTGISSVTNFSYEFASYGFLSSFLIQSYNAAALANTVARATTLLSAGGVFNFKYGRKDVLTIPEDAQVARQDRLRSVYPDNAASIGTGGTLQARNFSGEFWFDFLRDSAGTAIYSAETLVDLNPSALAGDVARLNFRDLAATTNLIQMTEHRLLPFKREDLNSLFSLA